MFANSWRTTPKTGKQVSLSLAFGRDFPGWKFAVTK